MRLLDFARNDKSGQRSFITRITVVVIMASFALIVFSYAYAHHVSNPLPTGIKIDRILIEKSAGKLSVFANAKELKTYHVALGRNPVGAKQEEGDKKTPEGIYKIDGRNAQSSFHLALHVSYPSDEDKTRAAERGVSAGSDIMIHGIRNGLGWIGAFHRLNDWTIGCIAVTDKEIEELWRITPDGTAVEIRP